MRIHLSARPGDAPGYSGRLQDEIARRHPAAEFVSDLSGADVLMLLIGPHWLRDNDDDDSRLLQVDDPVRRAIESAMDRGVHVVPLLLRGAQMPTGADLPEHLQPFRQMNAWALSHQGFRDDVAALLAGLARPSREAAKETSRIEISTPIRVVRWVLDKDFGPVRVLIDGEDRGVMKLLNRPKETFEVDAGRHIVTLRTTGKPTRECTLDVTVAPGETARLRASHNSLSWNNPVNLELLR